MNNVAYPIIIDTSTVEDNTPVGLYNRCIIHGDAIETMRKFNNNSVNLIITSPPYNMRAKFPGFNSMLSVGRKKRTGSMASHPLCFGYDEYSDDLPETDYIAWQRECLQEMWRLLTDDGAIYYNQKWRMINGLLHYHTALMEGFHIRQIIIWDKSTTMNYNKSYYAPTYEVIYLICKNKFYLNERGHLYRDIWTIAKEKNNPHPAPFPVKLVDTILDSTKAATVLDPFGGSGTTAVSCVKEKEDKIRWVLIEKSRKYCEYACNRIRRQTLGMRLIRPIITGIVD